MWKLVGCWSLLLALSACSNLFGGGAPDVTNPPPPGISYRADTNDPAATDRKAQDYCGRYGKKAKREDTTKASDSTIVQYSCR